MIDSRDISFVIQGKNISGETSKCFKSIRKYFPGATIIFSTYENEPVDDLDFDVVVYSKDPGAEKLCGGGHNQINRILTTSKAGLARVKTEYCAKMRSDLIFMNNHILKYDSLIKKRLKQYSVFEQRMLIFQLWTRLSYMLFNYEHTPLYFSDWFCFGKTTDVKNYYEASPLTKEPAFTNYFQNEKNRKKFPYIQHTHMRFDSEQYMGNCFWQKFFPAIKMDSLIDYSDEKVELANKILANNYIVGGFKECGFIINKAPYKDWVKMEEFPKDSPHLNGLCTYKKFLDIYKQYCDPTFVYPAKYRWESDLHIKGQLKHICQHWDSLKKPVVKCFHWFDNILSCVYYLFKLIAVTLWFLPRFIYRQMKRGFQLSQSRAKSSL